MGKKIFYQSSQLSLFAQVEKEKTIMTLQMFTPVLYTHDIANTVSFLQTFFPSVLHTECFNDQNLPFAQEAKSTEIGHLFEHILLEQLCMIKMQSGFDSAVFNGRTRWNWEKDTVGIFHIFVDVGERDVIFLTPALEKTVRLIEALLRNAVSMNIPLNMTNQKSPSFSQQKATVSV